MDKGYKCVVNAVIYAVSLNLILPMVAKPFATKDEIKPPNGAANLSFKSQIVHMLVHHSQVPIASSVIVALIVALSITLGYKFKILK
jgi:hypothetical protein